MGQNWLLLVASALFLLPHFAQAEPTPFSVQAATLNGAGNLDGLLRGMVSLKAKDAEAFDVHIVQGVLEVDEQRIEVATTGIGLTPANETTMSQELQDARITSFTMGQASRLLALPTSTARIRGPVDQATWTAEHAGEEEFVPYASIGREPPSIDHAGAVRHTQSSGTLVVEAPFLFSVWDAQFLVTHQDGEETVRTGSFREQIAPGIERRIEREAFIFVQEGNVTFPMGPAIRLYLLDPTIDVGEGKLELHDPIGNLSLGEGEIPTQSRRIELEAPFVAKMAGQDGRVQFQFPQPPNAVVVDGAKVYAPTGGKAWPIFLSLLGIALVPAGAAAISQMKHRRRLATLDDAMRNQRMPEALATARTIRRRRPKNQEALVAESIALIKAERYQDAIRVLEAPGWTMALEPMQSFLRAAAEAGQGRRDRALEWLTDCFRMAPTLALQASAMPLLASLVREAKAKAVSGAVSG